ncbi:MAG: type II secretion system GspH family protein [Chloroflexi bacterium]|nr:type II secretion system GspH family protein [Chloroflexota bacterium]
MKSERGFTLIELLVVIAIMAVLFGITALALTNVGQNAKQETAGSEANVVQTAIDVYLAVNSSPSLSASTDCEKAGDGGNNFDVYLRRETRFYIGWDSDGNVLTASESSDCSSPLWTR